MDAVIDKIVDVVGNLEDGYDVIGESVRHERAEATSGDVVVISDMKEAKKMAALYMTRRGLGSNAQVEDYKNATGSGYTVAGIEFRGIPRQNFTLAADQKLNFNGKADGDGLTTDHYRKPLFMIYVKGNLAPIGAKYLSEVFTGEIVQGYGDMYVQAVFYQALTGNSYKADTSSGRFNGEVYKNHIFTICEAESGDTTLAGTSVTYGTKKTVDTKKVKKDIIDEVKKNGENDSQDNI